MNDVNTSGLKARVIESVNDHAKLAQVINDSLFSFGELGFHEYETSKHLTATLEAHGFAVQRGVAGMPTGWVARWGSGGPVIAMGSDTDALPNVSQKPGVAWHEPMVEGAPGHGEGHNSGQAVNITAALALKETMQREGIPGTLVLWPGIAEELLAGKAFQVRDGLFDGVDAVIFTHVGFAMETGWGEVRGAGGLISAEYTFHGASAHAAAAPWRGRSALDAVELDECRLEHAPRASAARATLALHHHLWRRATERGAGAGEGLVLCARDRCCERAQELCHLESHRRCRVNDDGYRGQPAGSRRVMAAALQQGAGGGAAGQHRPGRHADLDR